MLQIEGRRLQGVIFDMDGLMFDTENVYTITWPPAAAEFGYTVTTEQVIGAVGLNAEAGRAYFERIFGSDFPFYEIRKRRLEIAAEYIRQNGLLAKPGLYSLLDFLDSHGVPAAVATSSERARADWYLQLSGLTGRFAAVICGDEVTRSKPDPDIFLTAADRLHAAPENCIILEDSENGIRAAHAAGAFAVMIPDLKQPTQEIQELIYKVLPDLGQVPQLLQE